MINEIISMNGYGAYVWSAFSFTLISFAVLYTVIKIKLVKEQRKIKQKFAKIGIIDENNVVFSCGSGITASVLSLAYSMINDKYLPTVYDGSWVEYGKIK